ncbi:hypothetical protein HMN09_00350100 [Mycena chlorophos]|uniref:Uncharacterized protein n=1 Tax=Mycena chlorophos TaxID=658473 RepID=A0A8H6TJP6_MYCCL|nr:hypothetical protein HMN09_00350100 [Mycena chlorophos]
MDELRGARCRIHSAATLLLVRDTVFSSNTFACHYLCFERNANSETRTELWMRLETLATCPGPPRSSLANVPAAVSETDEAGLDERLPLRSRLHGHGRRRKNDKLHAFFRAGYRSLENGIEVVVRGAMRALFRREKLSGLHSGWAYALRRPRMGLRARLWSPQSSRIFPCGADECTFAQARPATSGRIRMSRLVHDFAMHRVAGTAYLCDSRWFVLEAFGFVRFNWVKKVVLWMDLQHRAVDAIPACLGTPWAWDALSCGFERHAEDSRRWQHCRLLTYTPIRATRTLSVRRRDARHRVPVPSRVYKSRVTAHVTARRVPLLLLHPPQQHPLSNPPHLVEQRALSLLLHSRARLTQLSRLSTSNDTMADAFVNASPSIDGPKPTVASTTTNATGLAERRNRPRLLLCLPPTPSISFEEYLFYFYQAASNEYMYNATAASTYYPRARFSGSGKRVPYYAPVRIITGVSIHDEEDAYDGQYDKGTIGRFAAILRCDTEVVLDPVPAPNVGVIGRPRPRQQA